MNVQPDSTTIATTQTVVFEPTSAGGGSFWSGDNLLATLTVLKRAGRQGRLSIRQDNRALDLQTASNGQRRVYRLTEVGKSLGSAEWAGGALPAQLVYRGREYTATPTGLSAADDPAQLIVALAPSSDWTARQLTVQVRHVTDLPLVVFFVFVCYDLSLMVNRPNMR